MRKGNVKGMVTGAIVGAAAVGFLGMMDRGTKQKMYRYATKSARKIAQMSTGFFK